MVKVKVLLKCEYCDGKAYLPFKEAVDNNGRKYMRYLPCPQCHGSGMFARWIDLAEYKKLLEQETCPHEHVATSGSRYLSYGEADDDLQDYCIDCGKLLD